MRLAAVFRITATLYRIDVTADAFLQAVLLRADALVHGLIALMKEELHVVAAHDLRILDALRTLLRGNRRHIGQRHPSCGARQDRKQTQQCKQYRPGGESRSNN